MTSLFTFNFPGGSLGVPLPPVAVDALESELAELIERLKATASATGRRSPRPNMEYRWRDGVVLELFCNPNLWPSPFAAKVLLTVRGADLRASVELELSQLREDIQRYRES